MDINKKQFLLWLFLIPALFTTSCATMINSDTVDVPVTTDPPGALVVVDGRQYVTPTRVTVPRGKGNFNMTITKEGFESVNVMLRQSMDMPVLFNLVFMQAAWMGIIVDLVSGDGYDVSPERVRKRLVAHSTPVVAAPPEPVVQPNNGPLDLEKKTYELTVLTNFSNQSWYPLPQKEMVSAVTDVALAELTNTGNFRFKRTDLNVPTEQEKTGGYIAFEVALIESIQLAKVTVTLQVPKGATFIASDSDTLENKDRRAIYETLEKLGVKASQEINAKLRGER